MLTEHVPAPAVKDRRVYLITNTAGMLGVRPTYTQAAEIAREWDGVIVELPVIADFRPECTPERPTAHWREEGTDEIGANPPHGDIRVCCLEYERDQLVIVYMFAQFDCDGGE